MAFEPLKNIYEAPFADCFGIALKRVASNVDIEVLKTDIYTSNWKLLSLKERMRHLTKVLHKYLSSDFEQAALQIIKLIEVLHSEDYKYPALTFLFLPDYIECFGINHFDTSMKAIEKISPFSSCEFAVRVFIAQQPDKAFRILNTWSKHNNFHIRRLASEGCRPKLPWAKSLTFLQKDPSPILDILDTLKNDKEDYVYRSVANNLNDISKDHPELVLRIAKKWKGKHKNTDWLIKHALRTLLKAGNSDAMKLFGYGDSKNCSILCFTLKKNTISIGEYLHFEFELKTDKKAINRLEYAIYFRRKKGDFSRKVFKISEKEYQANSNSFVTKKHSFKLISTRKYHKGKHQLALIVNGVEKTKKDFYLA